MPPEALGPQGPPGCSPRAPSVPQLLSSIFHHCSRTGHPSPCRDPVCTQTEAAWGGGLGAAIPRPWGAAPSGQGSGWPHGLSLRGCCQAVFRLPAAWARHFSPTSRKSLVLNVHSPSTHPSLLLPSRFPEILTLGCLTGPRPFIFSRPKRLRGGPSMSSPSPRK